MEILTLSTGRNILVPGSRDRERMGLYAQALDAFHIVVLSRKEHTKNREPLHDGNLHVYPTYSRTRLGMLLDAYRVAGTVLSMKREVPCVISTQDPLEVGFVGYLLSRAYGVPLNVQVHGDYHSPAWGGNPLKATLRRWLMRFVLSKASSIRVVSERIRQSLILHGVPSAKIRVLPIRPEMDRFVHAVRTRPYGDDLVVLTASRLAPEKDIPRIISAFSEMKRDCPRAQLRIVGNGEEEDHLRAHAQRCNIEGSVSFIPWTERIEEEMVNADVFALASHHEAYGLVLIESLAAGTPVVTTDVGCVGEVVKDGIHGIVVKDGTVTSFADALRRMCADEAFRTSAGGAGRALGESLNAVSPSAYAERWVADHSAH